LRASRRAEQRVGTVTPALNRPAAGTDAGDVGIRLPAPLRRALAALPHGRTLPDERWAGRHRGMVVLLWAHVVALPLVALAYGIDVVHSLAEGGVVAAFAIVASLSIGDRRVRTAVVSLGLLTSSAVLVHITGGLIEAHFHFFVVVTILSLYEDWLPFLLAIAYVALHHALGAAIAGEHVYDHGGDMGIKWAFVHAGFITALSLANLAVWRESERERRRTSDALARVAASEERYRSVVEGLEEGVMLVDEHLRVVTANPSAERFHGVAHGGLVGVAVEDLTRHLLEPGTDRPDPRVAADMEDAHLHGRSVTGVEVRLRAAGGRSRWLRCTARPLVDGAGAGPYSVVVSFADVTAQHESEAALRAAHAELERRAGELERSNADLEHFAYVASHDLSEPLRMVTSYLQLLRRRYHGQLDGDADAFIDYAVGGAGRMRNLIDDLLTYSRVGRASGPSTDVDLRATVQDTLQALHATVAEAGADVVVGPLPTLSGDALELSQLFQNLIANALKFRSEERAPRVTISAQPSASGWTVRVADNGIGVDPQHADRIFKMFQRLHTREDYPGTGIGLAVCNRIVERHGGRIWVEPTPGGGATFAFTLAAVREGALAA
jgi:PAS domain S-box-containing protein